MGMRLWVACLIILVGVTSITLGSVYYTGILQQVYAAVNMIGIVDGPDNSGYADFIVPPDDQRWVHYFYMFNYTNMEGILSNGDKPALEEVGPFVYYLRRNKIDVEFDRGGYQVSYRIWTEYEANVTLNLNGWDARNVFVTAPSISYSAVLNIADLTESAFVICKFNFCNSHIFIIISNRSASVGKY
jgi:hypothetical protein